MKNLMLVLLALLLFATPALSLQTQDGIHASRENAITRAIEQVTPAVVTINVVEIKRERVVDPFFNNFMGLFDFYPPRTRVRGRAVESIGTGFIFDEQGHILTNYHVIQNADSIASVSLSDGRSLEVSLVGGDERTDIAVLRARSDAPLPYARLGDSEDLIIGEWVIAIGNPFGLMISDPQPSVSVGVVSANHRRVRREVGGGDRLYQDMIQTDAAINPGNSGGPLVNAQGQVIGVNTMLFSQSGGHQGLGFAIPVNRARRVAGEIIQHGHRRNPWFGFRGEAVGAVNPYTIRQLGIRAEYGVLVTEILRTSPAYHAGLELGDVIIAANGEKVEHPLDVDFVNWGLFVGDKAVLEIDRKGTPKRIEFLVEEIGSGGN